LATSIEHTTILIKHGKKYSFNLYKLSYSRVEYIEYGKEEMSEIVSVFRQQYLSSLAKNIPQTDTRFHTSG
jgi:hypothetical protein